MNKSVLSNPLASRIYYQSSFFPTLAPIPPISTRHSSSLLLSFRKEEDVKKRELEEGMGKEGERKDLGSGRRNSLLPRIIWKGLKVRTDISAEKTTETEEILRDLNLSLISKEKEESKSFMKRMMKQDGRGKKEGIKKTGGDLIIGGGLTKEESVNYSKNYSKILSFSLSLKKEETEGWKRRKNGETEIQIGEEKNELEAGNEDQFKSEKEDVGRRHGEEKSSRREEEARREGKKKDNNENFFLKLDVDDFLRELIDNLIYLQNMKHNTKVIPSVLKGFLSFNEMIGEVILNKKKDQIKQNLSVLTIKMTLEALLQTFKLSKQEEKIETERGGRVVRSKIREKTNESGSNRKVERRRMEKEKGGEEGATGVRGGIGEGGGGWKESKKQRVKRRDIREKMRRSLTVLAVDEGDFEKDEVKMEMIKKMYYFNRTLKEYLERQNEEMCRFKSEKFREEFFVCHMKKDQYLQFMKSKNYEKYRRVKNILEKNENHLLVRNNIYLTSQIEKIENTFGKLPLISPKTRIMCKYVEDLLDGHKTELGKG